MEVRGSWFLLLRSYFLIRHTFNGYFWSLQNRQLLLWGTAGNFRRIFCRFTSPKIILKFGKTWFKKLFNSMKRDLETSAWQNLTKNSLIEKFCREKFQELKKKNFGPSLTQKNFDLKTSQNTPLKMLGPRNPTKNGLIVTCVLPRGIFREFFFRFFRPSPISLKKKGNNYIKFGLQITTHCNNEWIKCKELTIIHF